MGSWQNNINVTLLLSNTGLVFSYGVVKLRNFTNEFGKKTSGKLFLSCLTKHFLFLIILLSTLQTNVQNRVQTF